MGIPTKKMPGYSGMLQLLSPSSAGDAKESADALREAGLVLIKRGARLPELHDNGIVASAAHGSVGDSDEGPCNREPVLGNCGQPYRPRPILRVQWRKRHCRCLRTCHCRHVRRGGSRDGGTRYGGIAWFPAQIPRREGFRPLHAGMRQMKFVK